MTTKPPPKAPPGAKPTVAKLPPMAPVREQDLAAALRENLRRRKAQAQARAATTPERDDPPDT